MTASDSAILGTGRNCGGQGNWVAHLVGRNPELHDVEGVALQNDLFAAAVAEIDYDIGALTRRQHHAFDWHRRRQQSLIGSDLLEG